VRSNNEDAVVFDAACGLAILADGMGGYNAGEVASGMAIRSIHSELGRWISSQSSHSTNPKQMACAIERCVEDANRSILKAADANPNYFGMGTTVVVGVFQGPRLILGHVGDSRCYRLRDGALEQITKDHSMLQEQVDAGLLTVEEAAVAPGRNLLTRALGVEESSKAEIHEHVVKSGDIYVMCSDGLNDMVSDKDIALVLISNHSLGGMASELVSRANANGGRDNVSVLLTQATSCDSKPGLISRFFGKHSSH
jgi:protein phosphatase